MLLPLDGSLSFNIGRTNYLGACVSFLYSKIVNNINENLVFRGDYMIISLFLFVR